MVRAPLSHYLIVPTQKLRLEDALDYKQFRQTL